MKRLILAVVLCALLVPSLASAQKTWNVVMAWNPNTEEDLKEYKLYENGAYVVAIPAGTETVTRVVEAGTYSWCLTAVDDSMNESGQSNSVGTTLDETAPIMENVNISITISVHVGP